MADQRMEPPQTIPVLEERLRVVPRAVETERVVLRKTVREHEEPVELTLATDALSVERVPVNRVVASAPAVREEGDTLIVPVLEETMVVETRLVLKEELRIRRTRTTRTERRHVTLRREEVAVEHHDATGQATEESDVSTTQSTNPIPSGNPPATESSTTRLPPEPSVREPGRQIVAMFETYAQAEKVRERLLASGVSSGDMEILDRDAKPADATVPYERTNAGFWGAIKRLFVPDEDAHGYAEGIERGHAMLAVRPRADQRDEVIRILESFEPIDLDRRQQEWRDAGWSGVSAGAAMYGATGEAPAYDPTTRSDAGRATFGATAGGTPVPDPTEAGRRGVDAGSATFGATGEGAVVADPATGVRPPSQTGSEAESLVAGTDSLRATSNALRTGGEDVIPVVEERLRVGKREVAQGAVRVRSYVVETPAEEEVRLRQESVRVERHPVDRPATDVPGDAFRERTIEVQATSEEPVVGKEARVVEEVGLRKDVGERTETVRDTTRRTEVKVEDERGNEPTTPRR